MKRRRGTVSRGVFSMSIGRRSRRLLFLLAGILALAAGVAYATIPDSNGVIAACYSRTSGSLRVIDSSSQACSATENPITWNHTGPTGPQGPAGPQGAPGPQGPAGGLSGYEVKDTDFNLANLAWGDAKALCSAGKHPLGGGFWTTNENVDIVRSQPPVANDGWYVL